MADFMIRFFICNLFLSSIIGILLLARRIFKNSLSSRTTYWMESSLGISFVEQVELLTKLQNNSLGFAPENIKAVKDAICLSASDAETLYGKTGTGRVEMKDSQRVK